MEHKVVGWKQHAFLQQTSNKQSLKQSSALLSQAAGIVTAGITVCGLDSCFSQSRRYLCLPHAETQLRPTADWQYTDFEYQCKIHLPLYS